MIDVVNLSIKQAKDLLEKKEISSLELTKIFLERINKLGNLNSFVLVDEDKSLKMAQESDNRISKKDNLRLLEGIPISVKDLFCMDGLRTTACSKMLENFVPHYDSTVTKNLFNCGAVFIGKTNMDEFAMGSTNEYSYFGHAVNPWKANNDDADLVPGGSSGGAAISVAAKLCLGALGSDTGGSVRQPAAFCGIVGLKPTYGRVSRYGMISFASSLDQAGFMGNNVDDVALLLEATAGQDLKDSTCSKKDIDKYSQLTGLGSLKNLKIGIPKEYIHNQLPSDIINSINNLIKLLEYAGAQIKEVSLPHTDYAVAAYYVIAPSEASSNLARYDGLRYGLRVCEDGDNLDDMYEKTRSAGFGSEVKMRILTGTYALSSMSYEKFYKKALQVRRLIRDDFTSAFNEVDILLTPSTNVSAYPVGSKISCVQTYMNDVFTIPVNLAGLPAISLPVGLSSNGLPLGVQLIGKMFDETKLLQAAKNIEEVINFKAIPDCLKGDI